MYGNWGLASLPGFLSLEKPDSSSLSSHQLPIRPSSRGQSGPCELSPVHIALLDNVSNK